MWPREEQMFIVFNRLNDAASAEQSDLLKRGTRRRRSSSTEIDGRHFLSRHRSAALQAHRCDRHKSRTLTLHRWRSNSRWEHASRWNIKIQQSIALPWRRRKPASSVWLTSSRVSENRACGELTHDHRTHSKSPIFSLLQLHKVTKTWLTKLPCKLMHQRLI